MLRNEFSQQPMSFCSNPIGGPSFNKHSSGAVFNNCLTMVFNMATEGVIASSMYTSVNRRRNGALTHSR